MMRFDFGGAVVVVTGAASGIGQAIAELFHDSNAVVAALDVKTPAVGTVRRCVDVTDGEAIQAVLNAVFDQHGRIDTVVASAGIQPPASYRPLHLEDPQVSRRILDVNYRGALNLFRRALPFMLRASSDLRVRGRLIAISSGQGAMAAPNCGAYGDAKAALTHAMKALAIDYGRSGILANAVHPGTTRTAMVEASLAEQGGEAALSAAIPIGRIAEAASIAALVGFLACDDNITGAALASDGGQSALASWGVGAPVWNA